MASGDHTLLNTQKAGWAGVRKIRGLAHTHTQMFDVVVAKEVIFCLYSNLLFFLCGSVLGMVWWKPRCGGGGFEMAWEEVQ